MTAALQDHLFAGGRATEPHHDAFLSRRRLPQHISHRGGGGRDHEDRLLKDGVDSIVQNRDHLLDKWVAKEEMPPELCRRQRATTAAACAANN